MTLYTTKRRSHTQSELSCKWSGLFQCFSLVLPNNLRPKGPHPSGSRKPATLTIAKREVEVDQSPSGDEVKTHGVMTGSPVLQLYCGLDLDAPTEPDGQPIDLSETLRNEAVSYGPCYHPEHRKLLMVSPESLGTPRIYAEQIVDLQQEMGEPHFEF